MRPASNGRGIVREDAVVCDTAVKTAAATTSASKDIGKIATDQAIVQSPLVRSTSSKIRAIAYQHAVGNDRTGRVAPDCSAIIFAAMGPIRACGSIPQRKARKHGATNQISAAD